MGDFVPQTPPLLVKANLTQNPTEELIFPQTSRGSAPFEKFPVNTPPLKNPGHAHAVDEHIVEIMWG